MARLKVKVHPYDKPSYIAVAVAKSLTDNGDHRAEEMQRKYLLMAKLKQSKAECMALFDNYCEVVVEKL